MRLYKDFAIVLNSYKLGDADKIIIFLSEQNGIIKAVAKGVRKTKSKMGGKLEKFSEVNLMLNKGKGLDTIIQVESNDNFYLKNIWTSYNAYLSASLMAEMAEKINLYSPDTTVQFKLLKGAYKSLNKAELKPFVIMNAYMLKSLSLAGLRPNLTNCVVCKNKIANNIYFSANNGGILCFECKSNADFNLMQVSMLAVNLMNNLLKSKWEVVKLADDSLQNEVSKILFYYAQYQLENKIKSAKIVRSKIYE
jgi:DNA repair protein RecO (recombination protein O)